MDVKLLSHGGDFLLYSINYLPIKPENCVWIKILGRPIHDICLIECFFFIFTSFSLSLIYSRQDDNDQSQNDMYQFTELFCCPYLRFTNLCH